MYTTNHKNSVTTFLTLLSAYVQDISLPDRSITLDEWREVINLARAHNIFALVFEKASENTSFINMPEYPQWSLEVMSIVAGQARRTETFLSLYKSFLKKEIHPIVMKGLICRQLYGEFCDHRPSGDEDILVKKELPV